MKHRRNGPPRPTGGKLPPVLQCRQQIKHSLQGLNTPHLALVLDATAEVLRERDMAPRLWSESGRTIQKFVYIGGRVYALAPLGEQKPEETEHGESGAETDGGAPDA